MRLRWRCLKIKLPDIGIGRALHIDKAMAGRTHGHIRNVMSNR